MPVCCFSYCATRTNSAGEVHSSSRRLILWQKYKTYYFEGINRRHDVGLHRAKYIHNRNSNNIPSPSNQWNNMLETNMLSLMSHYIFNIFVSSVRLYFILLFLCFETILRSFAVLSLDVFRKSANYNYRSFADYIFESLLIL